MVLTSIELFSLVGKVVEIRFQIGSDVLLKKYREQFLSGFMVVLRVKDVTNLSTKDFNQKSILHGDFIAGDVRFGMVSVYRIQDYKELTFKEYPLLVGYKYTSDLLAELLKG